MLSFLAELTVKINSNYAAMLPPLSKEEYEALKESIQKEGQRYPISFNEQGEILDGHNRFKICREIGLTPIFEKEPRQFKDHFEEKLFVINTNLKRRHLNGAQIVFLRMKEFEVEKEKAQARMNCYDRVGSREHTLSEETGKARDVLAEKAGVSPTTFQRAATVLENGSEKTKEAMLNGSQSINYAYKMTKRQIETREFPELPEGEYSVIYADPPWRYNLPFAGSPDMHYPTLETEKICRLNIPAAQNSVLFLWATNPLLPDALRVMQSWGYSYKSNFVWVKNRSGTGYYVLGQHELLLIGVKGDIGAPLEENRVSSVAFAINNEHSKKPELFYSIIEKMYPNKSKVELFARNKREGWASWGLELEN
jgi:N6-adenosine-specific RNA methylase IME4